MALVGLMFWAQANELNTSPCTLILTRRYFDGRLEHSNGLYRIRIRNHLIEAISKNEKAEDEACQRIELLEAFVLPGLIDTHVHLLMSDQNDSRDFSNELFRIAAEPNQVRYEAAKRRARLLLISGITTVRDLGNSGLYLDTRLRDDINKGIIDGPRMFVSGPGLSVSDAQFPPKSPIAIVKKEYSIINEKQDILKSIVDHQGKKVDLIKVYADNNPNFTRIPFDWLSEVVRVAHGFRLKVAAHATIDASARDAIAAGVDTIEHGYELSEPTMKEMKARGVALVLTSFSEKELQYLSKVNQDYKDWVTYQKKIQNVVGLARKTGISILFGSDAYVDFRKINLSIGQSVKEALYSYVEMGLTNQQALISSTSGAGRLFESVRVGVIEVGATADLIATQKSPMKDIKELNHITFVMKDGKTYCTPRQPCAGIGIEVQK